MKFAGAKASRLPIYFLYAVLTHEQSNDRIVDSTVYAIRMIAVGYEALEIECREAAESPYCADRTVLKTSVHKRLE